MSTNQASSLSVQESLAQFLPLETFCNLRQLTLSGCYGDSRIWGLPKSWCQLSNLSSLQLYRCRIPPVDLGRLPALRDLTIGVSSPLDSWEHPRDAESISRMLGHLPELISFSAIVHKDVLLFKHDIELAHENEKLLQLMPELDIKLIKVVYENEI